MKLAISTYNYFAVFDTRHEFTRKIDIGKGKYFGISWNESLLYVTVGVRLAKGEEHGKKVNRILCFDKNFNLKTELFNLGYDIIDIHQILLKDGVLWIVNTGKNRIDKFNLKTKKIKSWYPIRYKRNVDINHFNSILIKEKFLYIVAHNRKKPSLVLVYKYPRKRLKKKIILGKQAHNIYIDGDEIYVCDSLGTGNVISNRGNIFHIGKNYVRGLACSKNKFFVGVSKKAPRNERQIGDCQIYEFNRETKELNKIYKLEGAGNIYDIRILDEFEYCHNNKPFLRK